MYGTQYGSSGYTRESKALAIQRVADVCRRAPLVRRLACVPTIRCSASAAAGTEPHCCCREGRQSVALLPVRWALKDVGVRNKAASVAGGWWLRCVEERRRRRVDAPRACVGCGGRAWNG